MLSPKFQPLNPFCSVFPHQTNPHALRLSLFYFYNSSFQSLLFPTYILIEATVLLYFHRKHTTVFLISDLGVKKMVMTTWVIECSTITFGLRTERVKKVPLNIYSVDYHALQNTSAPITNSGPTDETISHFWKQDGQCYPLHRHHPFILIFVLKHAASLCCSYYCVTLSILHTGWFHWSS